MAFLTIFHELVKLQSLQQLNCITAFVTSYMRMNKQNMLIVAYMKKFEIFCKYHFV